MDIESIIKRSQWWRQAEGLPDRHYDPTAGITLADHLQAVFHNLRFLRDTGALPDYYRELREAVVAARLDPDQAADLLGPVALLHDIGKTQDDKDAEIEHPITGKRAKKRHPVVSVMAACELLPEALPHRNTILALIEDHGTPHSWYVQFKRTAQVPGRKSWARQDRKIDAREDGTGLVLLALFKFADIDGHKDMQDVPWFIQQANSNYLVEKGRALPVPDIGVLEALRDGCEAPSGEAGVS